MEIEERAGGKLLRYRAFRSRIEENGFDVDKSPSHKQSKAAPDSRSYEFSHLIVWLVRVSFVGVLRFG
jgi:hypothetical protein